MQQPPQPPLVDLLDSATTPEAAQQQQQQPQDPNHDHNSATATATTDNPLGKMREASPLRIQTATTTIPNTSNDKTPPSTTNTTSSPFPSPEPFSHPSSPICNDSSLTHENLHLLDHSLTLTEHDDGPEYSMVGEGSSYETILGGGSGATAASSSYVSFPSRSTSRSRANSIVSSAVMSTSTVLANNTSSGNVITSRRRRPRPWDNFNGQGNDVEKKDVETTPLLASRHMKASIHSVKTAKRGNVGGYLGRKRIVQEHYNDNNNNGGGDENANVGEEEDLLYEKVQIQDASPSLEWKEGVFIDHYGSIHENGNRTRGGIGDGVSMGAPASSSRGVFLLLNDAKDTCTNVPFMMIVLSLTVLQFVLMALYNIFLHYHSHRLNHQPPYAFWFSAAGRIYNSGIGPNVPTLIMFGVFHPFLVITEWWRMASGMVCCTSLVEFVLNVFWLRLLMGMEEEKSQNGRNKSHPSRGMKGGGGGMVMGFVFGVCGIMGGLAHMIKCNGQEDGYFVTGLNSAGIVGCMAANSVMDGYNSTKSSNKGYDDGHARKRQFLYCGEMGIVHAAIVSELLCGLCLPFTSLTSVVFGGLMGVCCGMLLLNQRQGWDDSDSQSSSLVSDLEEAFNLTMNTPQKFNFADTPPPPPSSSSKGMDTPIMRRSILTSPEEDDEYDLVQSLNESGGKGLKQRNVRSAQRKSQASVGTVHDDYTVKRSTGCACSEARLRFMGLMGCLLMLSCSLVYIGFALSTPSDQVLSDSLYGCRTVHGLFQYAQDGATDIDDGTSGGEASSGNLNVYEGETVCGELCIPIRIYDRIMKSQNSNVSFLEHGSCSQNGYNCNYSSEVFDAGFTEIEQDLYKKGECVSSN